ncbi:hybrid sensor histidine kinase/response regulator, partial [Burkholderia cenocepacia]|nr:hybrid sensor histidine kinase/response regulator [Burkholderia cenocepacia]
TIALTATHVDVLLAGVDLRVRVGDPQGQPVSQTEIDVFAAALTGADGAQTMQAPAAAPPPVPPSVAPYRDHDGAANEPVGASAAVPPLAVSGAVPHPAQ